MGMDFAQVAYPHNGKVDSSRRSKVQNVIIELVHEGVDE